MTPIEMNLQAYADLVVRIALNLRPGQRLLIIGPLAFGGVSLEAQALVERISDRAYRAGARYVEAIWGSEALQLARFNHAPRDSFEAGSDWFPDALVKHVDAEHAVLSISANDPDLLSGCPPELVGMVQQAAARRFRSFRERISRNQTNWAVIAAAHPAWAARVFPGAPPAQRMSQLWDVIARLCRLDRSDPIAPWEEHLALLAARRDYLNAKALMRDGEWAVPV